MTTWREEDAPGLEKYHGHPRFNELLREEAELHANKNHDYAQGGDPLGNFKRVSVILSMYPDLDRAHPAVVALVYMLKQVDAVLWGLNKRTQHKVEGYHGRLQDISVYAKLTDILIEENHAERT